MWVFSWEQCIIKSWLFQNWVRWQWVFLWKMDSACPEKDVTEILSDSDHATKVAPTTLILGKRRSLSNSTFIDASLDFRPPPFLPQFLFVFPPLLFFLSLSNLLPLFSFSNSARNSSTVRPWRRTYVRPTTPRHRQSSVRLPLLAIRIDCYKWAL